MYINKQKNKNTCLVYIAILNPTNTSNRSMGIMLLKNMVNLSALPLAAFGIAAGVKVVGLIASSRTVKHESS
jgi:hypothetical protein